MNYKHICDLISYRKFWSLSKEYIYCNPVRRFLYLSDYYVCLLRYGCTVTDYLVYGFYQKRHIAKKSYVTLWKLHKACDVMNDKTSSSYFVSKKKFNQRFAQYRNLKWISCSESKMTFEEFCEWCKGKDYAIIKKENGGGEGKFIIKAALKEENLRDLYRRYFPSTYLFEEVFYQDGLLNEYNPPSVNTLRVFTVLKNNGEVYIPYAIIRLGIGNDFRDNAAVGNIFALVDPGTGIIITKAADKKGNTYAFHPVSSMQIVGEQIPRWDEVMEIVRSAAGEIPSVHYVGWDVAISSDKISLIEGNNDADPVMQEILLSHGIWSEYKEYMRIVRN